MKHIIILSSLLFVTGCTSIGTYSRTPPRDEPTVVPYHKGMNVNMTATHIDSKGNIISMYEPVAHCITEHYPNKKPVKICRVVK